MAPPRRVGQPRHLVGSLFLLEADNKEEVVAFNRADPFTKAGVWKTVNIHPFSKRVDNR